MLDNLTPRKQDNTKAGCANVTPEMIVGPLPVRPRRGKVVLGLVVVVLGAVRSNSENCPNIHFLRFTDPHKIQIPKAHDATIQ